MNFPKGLRKYPIGNFVSFPAEILRTSTNIVSRGLDEIFYTTKINGKTVPLLSNLLREGRIRWVFFPGENISFLKTFL